jgi:multidrug efflux pump subunit AcrB
MWIVRLALRRPYTFVVAAMLVALLGIYAVLNTPTDIFPNIDIPVISVAFNYEGMPADEMEKRVVGNFERILTTTVNDIEHIESQALNGRGIIKIYFQKGADIAIANAQVTAISQTATRMMPPVSSRTMIMSVPSTSSFLSGDESINALYDRTGRKFA